MARTISTVKPKTNPLARTEDEAPAQKKDKIKPIGILLSQDELERINEIAAELEQSRHAVLKYAVREFIRRYDAGERPEMVTIQKLK